MIVACKFGLEQGMLECVSHTCIRTYIHTYIRTYIHVRSCTGCVGLASLTAGMLILSSTSYHTLKLLASSPGK